MNNIKLNLWDREFELFVSYSCYPGEQITETQKKAVEGFADDTECVNDILDDLKRYVEQNSYNEIKADEIDNIFKYVMPESLFVPRTEKKTIAIMCNYKFDKEHGIAVVFEEGRLKEIGSQDIIL